MSLAAGSVTVNQTDGTFTGSGLAFAILSELAAASAANYAAAGIAEDVVKAHNREAAQAQALANAIVGYLTANAEVRVVANSIDSGVPSVDRTFGVA